MTDVFDWAESDRTSLDEEPRVKKAKFGDGYEQRQADGINSTAQIWSLSFEEVDDSIADVIIAFWRTHGGVDSFDWTPKWATSPIRVVCPRWGRTIAGVGLSNMTARFEEVFEP